MQSGLGPGEDQYHIVNFREDSGEAVVVDETSALAVFVAPKACVITDMGMVVTTSIAAASANHWTIQVVNQTGGLDLLSSDFDTDSDNSGNGGRSFTADTMLSLNDNGAGNNYLQNYVLAKGDVLILTATKGSSATDMANPVVIITYRA